MINHHKFQVKMEFLARRSMKRPLYETSTSAVK